MVNMLTQSMVWLREWKKGKISSKVEFYLILIATEFSLCSILLIMISIEIHSYFLFRVGSILALIYILLAFPTIITIRRGKALTSIVLAYAILVMGVVFVSSLILAIFLALTYHPALFALFNASIIVILGIAGTLWFGWRGSLNKSSKWLLLFGLLAFLLSFVNIYIALGVWMWDVPLASIGILMIITASFLALLEKRKP